jgi:hypothetical protein
MDDDDDDDDFLWRFLKDYFYQNNSCAAEKLESTSEETLAAVMKNISHNQQIVLDAHTHHVLNMFCTNKNLPYSLEL